MKCAERFCERLWFSVIFVTNLKCIGSGAFLWCNQTVETKIILYYRESQSNLKSTVSAEKFFSQLA